MLRLTLFGPLDVTRDDVALPLPPSRKSRALLGYLAATDDSIRRDALCEMFWDIPDDPRGALRWSLSKLRAVVNSDQAERLVADRLAVRFCPTATACDLSDLRVVAQSPDAPLTDLMQVWDRTQGVFLAECDLPNQPLFTRWLEAERASLAALRQALATRVAAHPDLPPGKRALWAERGGADSAPSPAVHAATLTPPRQDVRFVQAHDGPHIAWAEVGEGPTIVKAANWLTHLELDWEAPIWNPLFHDLARDHHLVRYDERGCGLSDWDVDDISFDAFVTDLEQVVDAAGVDRFTLLGISQGAAVSIEYAARHPERVDRLVLFGGYPAGWRHTADADEVREREAVMVLTGTGWGRRDPTYRRLFSHGFMPDATLEELEWFDDFQRRTTSPENAVRFLQAFSELDVRHRLADLQVPTLILHSRGDRRIPYATARDMALHIPGARLATLESDSHLLIGREPAAQAFVAAVRDFIHTPA